MQTVHDFTWNRNMKVHDFVEKLGKIGFQGVELDKASNVVLKMKKEGAKIFLTFTSNMVTSGLRGFFAQLTKLKIPHSIITTVGGIEEDIMKSHGEKFVIGKFNSDDNSLHEKGINRVGNLHINNESYMKFEDIIRPIISELYKQKPRWAVSELLREIGLRLNDENSFLYQAAKNNIPVYCPAITDGAFGFHLYLFQQTNKEFVIDVVQDFGNIMLSISQEDKKGLISLGGSISKHHAILASLLNGGLDYAVYMTTASSRSGSMSGATTEEAKSWGKIKDDSDAATVIGDVSITFPLMMIKVLEILDKEKLLENG